MKKTKKEIPQRENEEKEIITSLAGKEIKTTKEMKKYGIQILTINETKKQSHEIT